MAWAEGLAERGTSAQSNLRGSRAAVSRYLADVIGFFRASPAESENQASQPYSEPASELACLHGVLAILREAERRGRAIGVGADRILIHGGVIGEDAYLRQLARHTGMAIENFANITRDDCPLSDDQLAYAAQHDMLPIRIGGRLEYVCTPRGYTARRISDLAARFPDIGHRIRLASHDSLHQFLAQHTGNVLGREAADGLNRRTPEMSAAPAMATTPRSTIRHVMRVTAVTVPFVIAPLFLIQLSGAVLAIWFLLFVSLRLAGGFAPRPAPTLRPRLPDDQLPVYTVVAALYREARSVGPLLQAIDALDYPHEKLDVKIVLEPDDLATRAAIARLRPRPHVEVIIAPALGPRTKPKALNYALTFARGSFVTVFDAEDRPHPNQLRAALDAFRAHGDDVACVQASLCIDNSSDGWLPRMFATEYAGQFDVFLQGFSAFEMPLPLGGSSNHFRIDVLRRIGAWDAYNVTEDADLGFRLARFGHRSVMFPSATWEEAPAQFGAWLRQRTRWMKGWMQTWSVHMRAPRRLWGESGAKGFFALNLLVGGNVLTALAHPIFIGEMLVQTAMRAVDSNAASFLASQFAELHVATIAAGYLSTIVIGLMGLARRRLLREAWVLLLTPLYWLCLSLAAWRALYQFLTDPYRWEKTEHGSARRTHATIARPAVERNLLSFYAGISQRTHTPAADRKRY
ncbi:glycosyltransferase [Afipia sp. Root123D2]|uniref:glycosyltransferase n=1 Tax=Afipia sp. Root123D2 TaxID=1736436 RepID=UPI0009EB2A03|nr:glycosyltransferase [Afipia sp. Root123D2]